MLCWLTLRRKRIGSDAPNAEFMLPEIGAAIPSPAGYISM
jgi:hypothetical protein